MIHTIIFYVVSFLIGLIALFLSSLNICALFSNLKQGVIGYALKWFSIIELIIILVSWLLVGLI